MAYTTIDDPSAYFQTATYTGTSASQSITNDGNSDLQPDICWIKTRSSSTYHHVLADSSRGSTKLLLPYLSDAEATVTNSITSFDTDGFTLGGWNHTGYTGVTYAAWQWKVNGGTTISNTDGTITSTVQANTDAGLSIVTFTSPSSGSFSIGHGLGVKPDMVITKSLNGTSNWWTWHKGLTNDTTYYLDLSATSAEGSVSSMWGSTGFTSSVFGMNYPASAYANRNYVAYCFASKQGYSKFGSYEGMLGTTRPVYTGFKPAFIMIKNANVSSSWHMFDTKRLGYNPDNNPLYANLMNAETTYDEIDIYSNGFRVISSDAEVNGVGNTIIYAAFAENPFVTSTGIPTTAR